ncbi:MAG: FAD-dependent oxidoreductase [Chloroflexi bacterium]|nr:FAD-dependent oxidoreductase [Chloroflexota bacterium]
MNQKANSDVVILGGGVVGCATAYYLSKLGVKCTIVERDTVAGHASGFALGGLSPLGGAGIPDPLGPLSLESFRMHTELGVALREETGVDTEFQLHTAVNVAYTEEEAAAMRSRLSWQRAQKGFRVDWKEGADILAIEPRLAPGALGGIVTQYVGLLDPYKLALAFLQGAESRGCSMRHGVVQGLIFQGDRVAGVQTSGGTIRCERVVVAMGAWSKDASAWLGCEMPVEPLKGQILRLRVKGPPLLYVSWGHSYAVSKPDDLVWVGTTEELVGFYEAPTKEAQGRMIASALEALPYLLDAEVVLQTACLRPVTPDGLPILGKAPGKEGVVVATGGGRKGIHFSPIMGRIAADLVFQGSTAYDISALAPGRPMVQATVGAGLADPFRF